MSDPDPNDAGGPATDDEGPSELPPITAAIEWFNRPDPVLQDLVSIANIGYGLPVTLYMPWGVVSGHVQAPHEFFAAAAETNRAGARESDDENAFEVADAVVGRAFDPWGKSTPEADRQSLNLQQGYDLTTFIHLTHVKAWLSGSGGPIEHDHLRIRLSAVSAWAHGMVR